MIDPRPSLRTVLERLAADGLATADVVAESARVLAAAPRRTPWYLTALTAIGAWLAALFLLAALMLLLNLVSTGKPPFLGIGVALVVAATFQGRTARTLFFAQGALAVSLAGQLTVLIGVGDAVHGASGIEDRLWISGAALAQAVILHFLYTQPLHRLLASLLALLTLVVMFAERRWDAATPLILKSYAGALALALAALGGGAWTREDLRPVGRAVGGALVVALCVIMDQGSGHGGGLGWSGGALLPGLGDPLGIVVGAALILVLLRAAGGPASVRREPVALALAGALALTLLTDAGVLTSVLLCVLGLAADDDLAWVAGGITLPFVLGHYYYSLQVSLLAKSGALAASGAVLLVAAAYLARRPWAREEG
ncbi:MAG: DUF4401 domain-containing protein [Planctomycetes bacterium]|nr:DUF4401 domain-containing protein [Planctomycetota bacterium]